MKKVICIFIVTIVLGPCLVSQEITLEGYVFLEGDTNHVEITILCERTHPSQALDSVHTDDIGYFSLNIDTGLYNITYQKATYFSKILEDVNCDSNKTLDTVILSPIPTIYKVPEEIPTIQGAIDSTRYRDIIIVSRGVYYENINLKGKGILLTSNFYFTGDKEDIDSTIIDGGGDGSVVIFHNNEDSHTVFCGFSIRNGYANGSEYPYFNGGGICCAYASPILKNLIVYDNKADLCSGGVYLGTSNSTISNIEVFDNEADDYGGGISMCLGDIISDNLLVYKNYAPEGGGIWCYQGSQIIRNSTICHNFNDGIYVLIADLSIHNSIISNNKWGMGINAKYSSDDPLVSYCNLWDNRDGDFYNCNPLYGNNVNINSKGDSCDAFYNISLDPKFLNIAKNNYRLICSSPCVEAGSNNYAIDSLDLDNNVRKSDMGSDGDTIVDIGAFETPELRYKNYLDFCEEDSVLWRGDYLSISGKYYDTLSSYHGCDSIVELTLVENSKYFIIDDTAICQGGAYSWQGDLYTGEGTYYAKYSTNAGCDSIYQLSLSIDTTCSTNIKYNTDHYISIYPNPVKDFLIVDIYNPKSCSLEIYDPYGVLLQSANVNNTTHLEINMTEYRAGLYLLLITNRNKKQLYKIVKY